jgi:protoporphyrinogen oxidase
MERVHTLIVGAGMSGLAFANFTREADFLVLEAEQEPGGYCRTVHQDGFVWDYSGHFFHFRHPEVEQYLVSRMPEGEVQRIVKSSKVLVGDVLVDFPFQKNIHQLPKDAFIDCLVDLFFRPTAEPTNFRDMLYGKFGRAICETMLIPYNEKLYACDLAELDADAMGRFFPHANLEEIVRNFREPDNRSYNATFTYPRGGAIEYVNALLKQVPRDRLALCERLLALDLDRRVARTTRRELAWERVVSSAPLNRLLEMAGVEHDPAVFTSNKVLVFNLGFDRKGWDGLHWVYVPERHYAFYRVGFYDNIFGSDRMSLYVEIGLRTDAECDVEAMRLRVLEDLADCGIVTEHRLVAWHAAVLDPAYVHVTGRSTTDALRLRAELADRGVYSIGRYGGWRYCAIEDNLIEARELVERLEGFEVSLA